MLSNSLGPDRTVDVHLVVSEGMNIARGPVCTSKGGPVFLSDGAARTEMTMNDYGYGRESVAMPLGGKQYDVGISYGADSLVALQQWMGDVLVSYTRQSWGPRAVGEGTLAGGSKVDGATGMPFKRIYALGSNWKDLMNGFYHTVSYEKGEDVYKSVLDAELKREKQLGGSWVEGLAPPKLAPTIDIYGPVRLPDN